MNQSIKFYELFGNKKIIEFFIKNPSKEPSQTEFIKNTKVAKATAVKWMNFFVKNNLLHCKKIGTTKLYSLNNENPVIKQVKILYTITLLQNLKIQKNNEVYFYGSSARGENLEGSDIDLLILGSVKRTDIVDSIENLSKKTGKDINFKVFSHMEWSLMEKKDSAYFERVEKDKIRIS